MRTRRFSHFFKVKVKHVLYTCGAQGSNWITPNFRVYVPAFKVNAIDTTGAGDSFSGSILYQLAKQTQPLEDIVDTEAAHMLKFANTAAALTTEQYGAIPALVTEQQVLTNLSKYSF